MKKLCPIKLADPAYWVPEVYSVQKSENREIIGINLIRENIFSDYDRIKRSNEDLYMLYQGIVEQLESRGYRWKFFTNGIDQDLEFGKNLCDRMGYSSKEYILPVAKNTKDYVEQVSHFKAVIAGRMHATITAFALNIPVCAFVWSIKMRYFADDAHIGEYFLEGNDITAVKIIDTMERAIKQSGSVLTNDMHRNKYKLSTLENIRKFLNVNV